MCQSRKCIHRLTVQQDIQLHQFGSTETIRMIIKRRIPFGNTLQLIVEIDHNLSQRHIVIDFHTITGDIFLFNQFTTFTQAKRHNRTDIIGGCNNRCFDIRFLDMVNHRRVGHTTGVVHLLHITLLVIDMVGHVRHRSNHIHVKLTIQTLLHNLHVEQSEETTTETKTQSQRRLRLESQRRIIQLQLFQRRAKIFEILRLNRINPGKHHRLHFLKTGNSLVTRTGNMRNGISHLHLFRSLDTGNNISHIPRTKFVARYHIHFQHSHFIGIILFSRIEEFHLIPLANHTVFNLEISNNSTERVEYRVENQSLQRSLFISFRMRNTLDHGRQYFFHSHTRFAGCTDHFLPLAAQQFNDLVLHFFGIGTRHIAFINHRNNLKVVLNCHVQIRDSLCLHSLRSIDNQQRTFTRSNRARHLIRKVHMSRSVNQVKDILLPLISIFHLDCMALDSDPPFFLQIHIIKHLPRSHLNSVCKLQQTVGQSRFPVVNMSNNAKVAYILHSEFLLFLAF